MSHLTPPATPHHPGPRKRIPANHVIFLTNYATAISGSSAVRLQQPFIPEFSGQHLETRGQQKRIITVETLTSCRPRLLVPRAGKRNAKTPYDTRRTSRTLSTPPPAAEAPASDLSRAISKHRAPPRPRPLPLSLAAHCFAPQPPSTMSVAYEPRNFIHDGAYPPIDDDHDHDHTADHRFTDNDVAEQLSHYTTEASMLPDGRDVMDDDRDLLQQDDSGVHDASRLDLGPATFPSPIPVPLQSGSISDPMPDSKEPSPAESSPSSRVKPIPKPNRNVAKDVDGKFHCPLEDCKEDIQAFARKCEWK